MGMWVKIMMMVIGTLYICFEYVCVSFSLFVCVCAWLIIFFDIVFCCFFFKKKG